MEETWSIGAQRKTGVLIVILTNMKETITIILALLTVALAITLAIRFFMPKELPRVEPNFSPEYELPTYDTNGKG